MAKKAKIQFNKNLEQQLRDLPVIVDDIARRTKAIADACNDESSWDDPKVGGGYFHHSQENPTLGRVWTVDKQRDESRKNRMIRNLDAGS